MEKAARLIAWLRLRPTPGQQVDRLPLAWIGINAVEVDQRVTLAGRVVGVSTGAADQQFQLPAGSVDPATLQIEVEEPGQGYQPWQRIDDLGAIDPDPNVAREAAVYELDAAAGVLRFGDGVRGRVPEREMRIRLAFGRFGGGRAGNLAAGSMTELSATLVDGRTAPGLKVFQPLAADGGADAETLAQAEQRVPAYLRHHDRAVTANDYRSLAFETPGLGVGRVEVLSRFKPRDRRFDVAGVVSVMALPLQPLSRAPNPRPDRPFIERLYAYLAARAPLATELYVIGCEYVPLGVSIGVTIRDGFAHDQVLNDVRQALQRLLWPLPPGGVDANGWPLGRRVKTRELEVEVSRVAGVSEVTGLKLFAPGTDAWRPLPTSSADATQSLELAGVATARAARGRGRRRSERCTGRADRRPQPIRRSGRRRGAGRSRAVLMDANGLRFWLLADGSHFPSRRHAVWDHRCRVLRLASERTLAPPIDVGAALTSATSALERVPRTLDAHGSLARWIEQADAEGNVGAVAVTSPHLPGETLVLRLPDHPSDLAAGHDGVLYVVLADRVLLHDLRGRWPDEAVRLAGFAPWRMAADAAGGAWIIERASGRLARLEGLPLPLTSARRLRRHDVSAEPGEPAPASGTRAGWSGVAVRRAAGRACRAPATGPRAAVMDGRRPGAPAPARRRYRDAGRADQPARCSLCLRAHLARR